MFRHMAPDYNVGMSGGNGHRPGEDSTLLPGASEVSSGADRTPAAALSAVPPSGPRVLENRFEVGEEIARGGLGRIRRAWDRRLGRPVAVKELLRQGDSVEERFLREAAITARLEHPAIVPVHDAGHDSGGAPYYAMKLVNGRPLSEELGAADGLRGRLALLPHLIAVSDAVAYAHSQGVIHRDLKPQNVLVGAFGETVVIDWGLAKDGVIPDGTSSDQVATPRPSTSTQMAAQLTGDGAVLGTPAYM